MQKKIPDHAERVFKGVLFDVYQWQQEMFDGTFSTFEVIKRNDLVCVVAITKDNKILINNEEQPYINKFISLPKGRMEGDESMLDAAKRELIEETGYTSSEWNFWQTVDIFGANKIEWNAHYFIAKNATKTHNTNPDPGERIETFELTWDEVVEKVYDPSFRENDFSKKIKQAKKSGELEEFRKFIFGN